MFAFNNLSTLEIIYYLKRRKYQIDKQVINQRN